MRRSQFVRALVLWSCIVPGARAQGWAELVVAQAPAVGLDVQQTSDGGLIVAAMLGAGPSPWLLKLDQAGAIEWQQSCGISARLSGCRVRQAPDGGYVVAGSDQAPNAGPWIMKLDAAGSVSWQRTYAIGANAQVAAMTLLGDEIVVVGNYNCANAGAFALRVADDGAPIWLSAIVPGAASGILCLVPSAVQATIDGSIVIAGTSQGWGPSVGYVRLDGAGSIVAQDRRNLLGEPTNVAVVPTADGGFLLGGGIARQGTYLLKYAAGGWIEWDERLTSPDLREPAPNVMDVVAATIGGFWIAGRMDDLLAGETMLVAHVTADGAIDWQRLFGPHAMTLASLATMSDGGVALSGTAFQSGNLQAPLVFAMRLDALGSADASCGTSRLANLSVAPAASEWMSLHAVAGVFLPASQPVVAAPAATTATVERIGDRHEPDDSCSRPTPLRAGETTRHDFCDDAADWYSFDACSGTTYTLATSSLGLAADTVIEIFAADCALLLASDDDGGGGRASRLDWSAPTDGVQLVRVRNSDGSAGPDREYDMTLLRTGSACSQWLSLIEANLGGIAPLAPGRSVVVGSRQLGFDIFPLVFEVEDAGDVLAARLLTGPEDGELFGVEPQPGGGILVAGGCAGSAEGLIAEMDGSGSLTWQKALAPAGPGPMLRIARRLRDGGLLAVGSMGMPRTDAWIVRLDASGSVVWSRVVGDAATDERAGDAAELATGGFIVGGQTESPGAWTLRLDAAGAVLWQRSFGAGTSRSFYGGLAAPAAANSAFVVRDGEVMHVAEDGTLIWGRRLTSASGRCGADLKDVVATPDGGCAVSGTTDCSGGCAVLAKLDASGDLEWSRCTGDGPGHVIGYETMSFDPGGFTLTGFGITNARGDTSPFIARTNASGEGACLDLPSLLDRAQDAASVVDTAFAVADMPVTLRDPGLVVMPLTLPSEVICVSSDRHESACADGLDDDADGDVDCDDADCVADPDCASADSDGDGEPNGTDCLPSDATAFAVPPEVPRLLVTRPPASSDAALDWTDMAPFAGSSTTYSVTTALLSELRRIRVAWGGCLGPDLTIPSALDAREVISDGYWYLVRAENACGPPAGERWGQDSLGMPRPGCR